MVFYGLFAFLQKHKKYFSLKFLNKNMENSDNTTESQQDLSDFIKGVHKKLREDAKILGTDQAWHLHCNDEENLKKYAKCMEKLATNYWDKNFADPNIVGAQSRNIWALQTCQSYFKINGEIIKYRDKELELLKTNFPEIESSELVFNNNSEKLQLLDVGSCYNPFSCFELFDTVALDISPATSSVNKCDFLNVPIGDKFTKDGKSIQQLKKQSFDVVVFSLLLEYLPNSKQRLLCCQKAYDLLRFEGLLIIITPDSKHQGANAKIFKSWRFVLADLGFSRVKYDKLTHLHCMAFRKSLSSRLTLRWADIHREKERKKENGVVYDELLIPQDLGN